MRTKLYAMITMLSGAAALQAQAVPAASQALQISAFGLGTGTYTGLASGRNGGITAGVDFEVRPRYGFYPSLELRGTFPFIHGQVDSQKDLLGGLRLTKHYGNLRPYADILVGRGEITYENGGFPNPAGTFQYLQSPSTVISPGVGLDYEITEHFAAKADVQFQHYDTPVTVSGSLYAKPISIGVVYHLHYGLRGSRYK